MPKASDFKTSDRVANSLFKGALFNRGGSSEMVQAKQTQQPQQTKLNPTPRQPKPSDEFTDKSDSEKLAKAVVAQRWNKTQDPIAFAIEQRDEFPDINEMQVVKAANEVRAQGNGNGSGGSGGGNGVPWWSAARNFNLELFRGGDEHMLRPSGEMLDIVSRRW